MLPKKMSNREVADVFQLVADLLQIKGEIIYKVLAYRKASDSILDLGRDINVVWREGKLTDVPGIGKAISEKIDELLSTGELQFLEKIKKEVPVSLAEVLEVPDLGPKKVALFWKEAGISDLAGLEAATRAGELRSLSGMGPKSEAKILAGIESLSRRTGRTPLGLAWPVAQEMLVLLRDVKGVKAAEMAGSLRRMRETIGDIDLLVGAKDSAAVTEAFVGQPNVARVLGKGDIKSSIELTNGYRAQLWVLPPERFGTALQYATGSKDHNVRLRELALKQGLSLSDQAITREDGTEILCATEAEVYEYFGLAWMPSELREDRGEIQAAQNGDLPVLIEQGQLRSDLHTHSTWSDGKGTIEEMARAAKKAGLKLIAITDHSHSIGVIGGMDVKAVRKRRKEIEAVQEKMGKSIRILQGVEVEIKADGQLDYPDEVLAELDIVIASLHVSLRQPRKKVTQRMLNAIQNPNVDIIGHPTGRLVAEREPADLDMDVVFAAAAESGVALEINANFKRLDLNDVYSRRAIDLGIPLSINTDAHNTDMLGKTEYGVATARRGWAEQEHVINSWQPRRLLSWLRKRDDRK